MNKCVDDKLSNCTNSIEKQNIRSMILGDIQFCKSAESKKKYLYTVYIILLPCILIVVILNYRM